MVTEMITVHWSIYHIIPVDKYRLLGSLTVSRKPRNLHSFLKPKERIGVLGKLNQFSSYMRLKNKNRCFFIEIG